MTNFSRVEFILGCYPDMMAVHMYILYCDTLYMHQYEFVLCEKHHSLKLQRILRILTLGASLPAKCSS